MEKTKELALIEGVTALQVFSTEGGLDPIIQEAKQRAEQAERERIASEERAKAQAEQARRDQAEAEERARQQEIQRQQAEQDRIRREQEQREANKRHVGNIRRQAKESLVCLGIDEDMAKRIVLAIHAGRIANVSIEY